MPKVLVTGGAGYIGSITAHVLARRGYGVVVVDELSRGHEPTKSPLPSVRLPPSVCPQKSKMNVPYS
jgi:UDP-glucose 4-epimerase